MHLGVLASAEKLRDIDIEIRGKKAVVRLGDPRSKC